MTRLQAGLAALFLRVRSRIEFDLGLLWQPGVSFWRPVCEAAELAGRALLAGAEEKSVHGDLMGEILVQTEQIRIPADHRRRLYWMLEIALDAGLAGVVAAARDEEE